METAANLSQLKKAVASAARGRYQNDLLTGAQCWSGADLMGDANQRWSGSYDRSRTAVLARASTIAAEHGWSVTLGYLLSGDPPRQRLVMLATSPRGVTREWVSGDRVRQQLYTPTTGGRRLTGETRTRFVLETSLKAARATASRIRSVRAAGKALGSKKR